MQAWGTQKVRAHKARHRFTLSMFGGLEQGLVSRSGYTRQTHSMAAPMLPPQRTRAADRVHKLGRPRRVRMDWKGLAGVQAEAAWERVGQTGGGRVLLLRIRKVLRRLAPTGLSRPGHRRC